MTQNEIMQRQKAIRAAKAVRRAGLELEDALPDILAVDLGGEVADLLRFLHFAIGNLLLDECPFSPEAQFERLREKYQAYESRLEETKLVYLKAKLREANIVNQTFEE